MSDFHDTKIWRHSRNLLMQIFILSAKIDLGKESKLSEQLRRSGIAIPANIARAFCQSNAKLAAELFEISRGCLSIVGNDLSKARANNLINRAEFDFVNHELAEINQMLTGITRPQAIYSVAEKEN